jgi:hypothetical protein
MKFYLEGGKGSMKIVCNSIDKCSNCSNCNGHGPYQCGYTGHDIPDVTIIDPECKLNDWFRIENINIVVLILADELAKTGVCPPGNFVGTLDEKWVSYAEEKAKEEPQ